DEQPLRAVVRVPVRARAGRELHTVDVDRRAGFIRRERRADDVAGERLDVAGLARNLRRAKNFHCATIGGLDNGGESSQSEWALLSKACPNPSRRLLRLPRNPPISSLSARARTT